MSWIDPNIDRWTRSLVAGLTLWIGLCGVSWASDADLVVVGRVVTMAAGKPRARALAVTGGKIAFVGDAVSARKRLRPGGRLIELEPGQVVIPGLIDSHVHMLDAGVMLQRCPLDEAKTKDRALEIIAEYSKAHPELEWVIGSGCAFRLFKDDPRGPSAAELDAVVADRPAVFYDQDGHSAWLNSLALKEARIDYCGEVLRGRIECDGARPWGTLREAAVDLVEKVVSQPTEEQWLTGLREAQTYLHSLGITMVQDANVNPRMLEIYYKAASTG